jgi:hypothetical protein
MSKDTQNNAKATKLFSYEVTMLVHLIADSEAESKTLLDEKGGVVTKRDVKLLNTSTLYGENEAE